MKKNIAFVLALVAFALISCEKNTPWEPGDPATTKQFIYFPVNSEVGVEIDPTAGIKSHEFVIARLDSAKELDVDIKVVSASDSAFIFPKSVHFKAGEAKAEVSVKFDNMKEGETYGFVIEAATSIDGNPYAVESPFYQFEATLIKYEPGVGVWVDNPVLALLGLPAGFAWTVDYKLASLPSGDKKLIIINPYTTPATGQDPSGAYIGCPFTEVGGLEVDYSKDYNMNLMIHKDGNVTMEDFDLGQIYTGVGMLSIQNYNGEASIGVFDEEINAVVFDSEDLNNNSVLYVGTLPQNYVGFWFYLSLEDFIKDQPEEESIPARIVKRTVFGAHTVPALSK